MKAVLSKIWGVRPGEHGLLLVLGVALLSNSVAQKIAEISSLSNFLTDAGVPQFLLLLIVSSIVSIVMTGVHSLVVDRFNRVALLAGICFTLGLAFLILRILFIFHLPNWFNYSLAYLLAEQQFTFFPLAFWILASDIFDMSQSQRLFPLLSTGGFIGNLLGIGVAALSPFLFQQFNVKAEELLILNALIYLVLYGVLQLGLQQVPARTTQVKTETIRETLTEGWEFIQGVPAFRFLTLSILGIIICENIIDFQFFVTSEAEFQNSDRFQTFLSLFTLARVLGYLAIQSFLTQRLIAGLNLKNSFLIMPVGAIAAAACVFVQPGLWGSVAAVTLQKLPQYTVDETARKAFQGLVPEERRGRVSLFMDCYLVAGGAIAAAVLTGVVILAGELLGIANYAYGYLAIAILGAVVALVAVIKMRSVYDKSLFNWRLKRRQRGKSVLDKLDF
jgi:AAA family ATP:ADP antiporter